MKLSTLIKLTGQNFSLWNLDIKIFLYYVPENFLELNHFQLYTVYQGFLDITVIY